MGTFADNVFNITRHKMLFGQSLYLLVYVYCSAAIYTSMNKKEVLQFGNSTFPNVFFIEAQFFTVKYLHKKIYSIEGQFVF